MLDTKEEKHLQINFQKVSGYTWSKLLWKTLFSIINKNIIVLYLFH